MADVVMVLLGISIILFFGFLAEFLFKKIHVPDILLLVVAGFALGPYGFQVLDPLQLIELAPIFTTFALLFLLYDGAFNISLRSLLMGAVKSLQVTLFNFFISVLVIGGVMLAAGFSILISLLVGFILGGISSAFVIPLLKQLKVKGETYSILTLESAITDVLCIVAAFTVMEIITLNSFSFQIMISQIASIFAVAGLIGILAGILWIVIVTHVFKENKSYMITIAYLILVYVITEFLQGNGAIAALFFGLVLRNSREITHIFTNIMKKKEASADTSNQKKKDEVSHEGVSITTESEQFFYSQIAFILKTFFFVYIGLLLNLADTSSLIIGIVIAVLIMLARILSGIIIPSFSSFDKKLIQSIFARGLAAAAIAQVVMQRNIPGAEEITNIVYAVVVFTILLSSGRIFFLKQESTPDAKETTKT